MCIRDRGVGRIVDKPWVVDGALAVRPVSYTHLDVYKRQVVDLRTITPYDDATVVDSVRRTGRCVVVQEAQGFACLLYTSRCV